MDPCTSPIKTKSSHDVGRGLVSVVCAVLLLASGKAVSTEKIGGDQTAEGKEWHSADAAYCLVVRASEPTLRGFLPIGELLLPGNLKNGLEIYGEKGERIPFFLDAERRRLLIAPAPESEIRRIYFGFEPSRSSDTWTGLKPNLEPLLLTVARANAKLMTANQRREESGKQIAAASEPFDRQESELRQRISKIRDAMADVTAEDSSLRSQQSEQLRQAIAALAENERKKEAAVRNALKAFTAETGKGILEASAFSKGTQKREVRHVYLRETPFFNQENNFAARFSGTLKIPETNWYVFSLNTAGPGIMNLQGKRFLSWPGLHQRSRKWTVNGIVHLEKGLSDFELLYQKGEGDIYAAAAWKRIDDSAFSFLAESDFSPGWPLEPVECRDREFQTVPILRIGPRHRMFLDRDRLAVWTRCRAVGETANDEADVRWIINKERIETGTEADFIFPHDGNEDHSPSIIFSSDSGTFPDFPVLFPAVDVATLNVCDPDVFLTLWLPEFLYDDEQLEMHLEIKSELPAPIRVRLKTEMEGEKTVGDFHEGAETIRLETGIEAKPEQFEPSYYMKRKYRLDGKELSSGMTAAFEVGVPDFVFDRGSVAFVPLSLVTELVATRAGFRDAASRRIVPILHRPNLAEIRNWELSRLLLAKVAGAGTVFTLSDDFAEGDRSFRRVFGETLAENGIHLEFHPWPTDRDGVPPILRGLSEHLGNIRATRARTALIIPPMGDARLATSVRLRKRGLAAIVQLLKGNESVRSIKLCTPFPALPHYDDPEMAAAVRELAREQGVEVIELEQFIEQLRIESGTTMNNEESNSKSLFPTAWSKEISRYLLRHLR